MVGRVVSTKMAKTATVLVESRKSDPLYGKSFLRSKKYLAEDPYGVSDGDIVIIQKSRPFSKRKHWLITKVLGRDIVSLEQAELQEEAAEQIAQVMPAEAKEEAVVETVVMPAEAQAPAKGAKKAVKTEKNVVEKETKTGKKGAKKA